MCGDRGKTRAVIVEVLVRWQREQLVEGWLLLRRSEAMYVSTCIDRRSCKNHCYEIGDRLPVEK